MKLGLDLGNGAAKWWSEDGHYGCILSQVAVAQVGKLSMAGLKQRAVPLIEFGNQRFFVGAGAFSMGEPIESTNFERYTGTLETRALFYASIGDALQYSQNSNLQLAIGLPIGFLTGDEQEVKARVRQVKKWLMGDHQFSINGKPYETSVESLAIYSQPVAALLSVMMDDTGNYEPEHEALRKREIGVLSVGFGTIEILVVSDMQLSPRFTRGSTAGTERLLQMLSQDGLYTLGELDEQLREGQLDIAPAFEPWARLVWREIDSTWRQAHKRFAKVIAVGGGAPLLRESLVAKFGDKLLIPKQPVYSVATGLYKALQ